MAVNYRGQFLISMPHIDDEVFHRSVIFIVEHTDQFVLGIIINQQNLLSHDDLKERYGLDIAPKNIDQLNFISGNSIPMKELLVLHEHIQKWSKTIEITPEMDLATSADVLNTIIDSYPEISHSIVDSYSVWDIQQFNDELRNNTWMPIPFDQQFLFSISNKELLWNELFSSSGINLHNLSEQMGSA